MTRIIIDTDLGADCDDAGAVALACLLHNSKELELIAIGHNTANRYGIEAADIICRYYGCKVKLGSCKSEAPNPPDGYARKLVERFGARTKFEDTPDAVTLYRQLLSENRDVTLIGIGQANNLSDLLNSPADEYGPCGAELIGNSVKEVIWMAGLFNDTGKPVKLGGSAIEAEYNVITDIPSARNFADNCPVTVTYVDYVMGANVKTLGANGTDPVSFAYREFCGGKRESWDLLAVLYAARRDAFRRIGGTVTINEKGVTLFKRGGKDGYLRPNYGYEHLRAEIEEVFGRGGKVCVSL